MVADLRLLHDGSAARGVPAHVTILVPFLPPSQIDPSVRHALADLFGRVRAFSYRFDRAERFDDTTVFLAPEPPGRFSDLTEAVTRRWPECPPYGGAYADITPHLTVGGKLADGVAERLHRQLADRLSSNGPVAGLASEVWLMTDDGSERWSVTGTFALAGTMASDVAGQGGPVAPDGSPVELYLLLPSFGEAEIIHAAIPPDASILELGSGVGRMTHELVRLGHRVTAVDESAEMLAHVRSAETVQARVEDLHLEGDFDCVLLASHFVNAADPDERRRLLEVCARHLARAGRVVIEAYPEDWHPQAGDVSGRDDIQFRWLRADWEGSVVTAELEYRIGDRCWTQGPFTAAVLDEAALRASLASAGLAFDGWLDERRTWFAARHAR